MLYDELCSLKDLIIIIYEKMQVYADIFEERNENKINFKNKCVKDFVDDKAMYIKPELTNSIHLFIDIILMNELEYLVEDEEYLVFGKREKNKKSFYDKLFRYQEKEDWKGNKGAFPINKCLNDLLGYRIVVKHNITLDMIYENLKKFITEKFGNKVSIYNASKLDYKALHVYFKPSNFCFPCELQIWILEDEKSNLKSHETYKQGYLYWEKYENAIKQE
ncbi:hypothetical protein ACFDA8_09060 [Staphylococcus epidermidis]|uniref:hypothetical protein n=1 Tax=Staphylococcus epidermidis TaxID=1282 RepID=UPI000AEA28F3